MYKTDLNSWIPKPGFTEVQVKSLLTARGSEWHLLNPTSPCKKHLCRGYLGLGKFLVLASSDTMGSLFAAWQHPGGLSLHDMHFFFLFFCHHVGWCFHGGTTYCADWIYMFPASVPVETYEIFPWANLLSELRSHPPYAKYWNRSCQ